MLRGERINLQKANEQKQTRQQERTFEKWMAGQIDDSTTQDNHSKMDKILLDEWTK